MINEKILLEILKSREDRANKQVKLLEEYPCSLISFTLNTPGEVKDNYLYRKIHKEGIKAILETLKKHYLKVMFSEEVLKITGPECYIIVDTNAKNLKKLMVDIEDEHTLGRIFDIDVFDKNHEQVSRSEMDMKPRKCLLCNKDARICMRNRTHTFEELIKKVEEMAGYLDD